MSSHKAESDVALAATRSFPGLLPAQDSAKLPKVCADLVGQSIGQYRIVRQLGRGGMGVVYEAVHERIGQRAAVKTLDLAYAHDPTLVQRFVNEARAAIIAQHASLVKVFDHGQLPGGMFYILMELLEGESMGQRLKRLQHLPESDAVRLTRQIASAMSVAHAKGIIHRDLKPENIFIVPDIEAKGGERPKVLDFGLAKIVDPSGAASSQVNTSFGMIMGTVRKLLFSATGKGCNYRPDQCARGGLSGSRLFAESDPFMQQRQHLLLALQPGPELGFTG